MICGHPERVHMARGMCRACYMRWLRTNNPDFAKRQRAATKSWVSLKQNADSSRIRSAHRHRKRLMESLGASLDDFSLLEKHQNYVCAICQKNPDVFHIDHDHVTNRVRGLLCKQCNAALGIFGDNLIGLSRAIAYLTKTPFDEIKTKQSINI